MVASDCVRFSRARGWHSGTRPPQGYGGIQLSGIVARAGHSDHVVFSNDLDADYERLVGGGVGFTKELADMPWGKFAILDDTCGNLVQLQQVNLKS